LASTMWRRAADAYADRDAHAAKPLDEIDDALDDLQIRLTEELAKGAISYPATIEMALICRFYERLGDHALHVTERIRYLASGAR
jgi:phosphate transport system protein